MAPLANDTNWGNTQEIRKTQSAYLVRLGFVGVVRAVVRAQHRALPSEALTIHRHYWCRFDPYRRCPLVAATRTSCA
jgi:hypothetical protein